MMWSFGIIDKNNIYLRLETYVRVCYDMNMQNRESGSKQQRIIHKIKRADIVLIIVCLLTAALLGVFFVVQRETGSEVRILYDGIELKRVALYSTLKDSGTGTGSQYFLITYRDDVVGVETFGSRPEPKLAEETSYNLISVTGGMVVVEAADCKDQICVRHKPVSSKGESIICLPHRLVVEIIGDEISGESLDGVVR